MIGDNEVKVISVFDKSKDGILLLNRNREIVLVNRWFEKFLNSQEERSDIYSLIPSIKKFLIDEVFKETLKNKKTWYFSYNLHPEELTLKGSDGNEYHFDLYISPGEKEYVLVFFVNITLYVKKIYKISKLNERLLKRTVSLESERKKINLLKDIATSIVFSEEDEKLFCRLILKNLMKYFGADRGAFFVYRKKERVFEIVEHINVDKKILERFSRADIFKEKLMASRAFESGKTYVAYKDKLIKEFPHIKNWRFKVVLIMPVFNVYLKKVFAVIYVSFDSEREFKKEELEFTETILKYINIGFERKELIESLISKKYELEKTLKEKIKEIDEQYKRYKASLRLALVGKLSASIVHEIGTPLTSIRANAELIKKYSKMALKSSNGREKLLEAIIDVSTEILEGTSRIMYLISGLRGIGKEDVSLDDVINFKSLIGNVIRTLSHRLVGRVEIDVDVEEDLPPFYGNRMYLEQILINLIKNAVHSVEKAKRRKIWVKVKRDGYNVLISVKDSGTGIEDGNVERLFEPLYTTKRKEGLGLGLVIVKDLVEIHGGRIEVESRKGKGAEFKIYLPLKSNKKK